MLVNSLNNSKTKLIKVLLYIPESRGYKHKGLLKNHPLSSIAYYMYPIIHR